jgi:hypothetical protein
MIISVVACGESAKDWFNTPCDISVGVNDCLKWGKDTDYLICVNSPFKFEPNKKNNYTDRKNFILGSRAKFLTSLYDEWKRIKKPLEHLAITRFGNRVRKGTTYFSRSSPFIAMSHAYNLGATDIILWGVDFLNHPDFKEGKRSTDFEMEEYKRFTDLISKDCGVWIGNENTGLNKYFEVWRNSAA